MAEIVREHVMAVRVSDEEWELLRAAAAKDQRRVADYVRVHMLAKALAEVSA